MHASTCFTQGGIPSKADAVDAASVRAPHTNLKVKIADDLYN